MTALAAHPLRAQNDAPAESSDDSQPADETKTPPEPAERGVKSPTEIPAVFKIDKELITEAEVKDFKRREFEYKTALRNGSNTNADRELIAEGIRVRVYSLTLRSNITAHEEGAKIVEMLRREILEAGRLLDPTAARSFREFVLKQLMDRCVELLDNHFYPRLQAVVLLANMNIVEPDPFGGSAGQAYTPALEPLMKALDEPGQLEAIKIVAVTGLTQINLRGATPPEPNQRIRMARSMIRELANPNTHEWYQERLLEGLGAIDQVVDLEGKPFIVTAIESTLNDRKRKWTVRAAAAKALGRAQLTPDMKIPVFVIDVVNLAREMAEAVNSEGAEKSPYWNKCFCDVYYAFRPADSAEVARGAGLIKKLDQAGMSKYETVVMEGYKQYLPLMNHAVFTARVTDFPEEMITPVREWLQTNAPADYNLSPDRTPTTTKQVNDTTRERSG